MAIVMKVAMTSVMTNGVMAAENISINGEEMTSVWRKQWRQKTTSMA